MLNINNAKLNNTMFVLNDDKSPIKSSSFSTNATAKIKIDNNEYLSQDINNSKPLKFDIAPPDPDPSITGKITLLFSIDGGVTRESLLTDPVFGSVFRAMEARGESLELGCAKLFAVPDGGTLSFSKKISGVYEKYAKEGDVAISVGTRGVNNPPLYGEGNMVDKNTGKETGFKKENARQIYILGNRDKGLTLGFGQNLIDIKNQPELRSYLMDSFDGTQKAATNYGINQLRITMNETRPGGSLALGFDIPLGDIFYTNISLDGYAQPQPDWVREMGWDGKLNPKLMELIEKKASFQDLWKDPEMREFVLRNLPDQEKAGCIVEFDCKQGSSSKAIWDKNYGEHVANRGLKNDGGLRASSLEPQNIEVSTAAMAPRGARLSPTAEAGGVTRLAELPLKPSDFTPDPDIQVTEQKVTEKLVGVTTESKTTVVPSKTYNRTSNVFLSDLAVSEGVKILTTERIKVILIETQNNNSASLARFDLGTEQVITSATKVEFLSDNKVTTGAKKGQYKTSNYINTENPIIRMTFPDNSTKVVNLNSIQGSFTVPNATVSQVLVTKTIEQTTSTTTKTLPSNTATAHGSHDENTAALARVFQGKGLNAKGVVFTVGENTYLPADTPQAQELLIQAIRQQGISNGAIQQIEGVDGKYFVVVKTEVINQAANKRINLEVALETIAQTGEVLNQAQTEREAMLADIEASRTENRARWEAELMSERTSPVDLVPTVAPATTDSSPPTTKTIAPDFSPARDGTRQLPVISSTEPISNSGQSDSNPSLPTVRGAKGQFKGNVKTMVQAVDSKITSSSLILTIGDSIAAYASYKLEAIQASTPQAKAHAEAAAAMYLKKVATLVGIKVATEIALKIAANVSPGVSMATKTVAGTVEVGLLWSEYRADQADPNKKAEDKITIERVWTTAIAAGFEMAGTYLTTTGLGGEAIRVGVVESMKALGVDPKNLPPYGMLAQLLKEVAMGESGSQKLLGTLSRLAGVTPAALQKQMEANR